MRLGLRGRTGQVLLEDLARGAVAEAAARGVVEPVGKPAEVGAPERLGPTVAGEEAAHPPVQVLDASSLPAVGQFECIPIASGAGAGSRAAAGAADRPLP